MVMKAIQLRHLVMKTNVAGANQRLGIQEEEVYKWGSKLL